MLKVLLVSRRTAEARVLRDELEANPRYLVDFEETAESAIEKITAGKVDYAIFNFDTFDYPQLKIVKDILELRRLQQVLVLAQDINTWAAHEAYQLKGMVIFHKAGLNMDQDLVGLFGRFLGAGEGRQAQRKAKRHPTIQKALIENLSLGRSFTARLSNLSEGGVSIVAATGSMAPGDVVKLTVELDKLGRTRIISGVVKWVSSSPRNKMAGIQFVKRQDVKKSA